MDPMRLGDMKTSPLSQARGENRPPRRSAAAEGAARVVASPLLFTQRVAGPPILARLGAPACSLTIEVPKPTRSLRRALRPARFS